MILYKYKINRKGDKNMIYYFTEKKGCKSLRDELMLFTSLKEAVDQKEHLEEFSGDEYEVRSIIVDLNTISKVCL